MDMQKVLYILADALKSLTWDLKNNINQVGVCGMTIKELFSIATDEEKRTMFEMISAENPELLKK